jgi:post-segregation antitoxin (ccd killing protein)
LSINSDVYAQAKKLGINASQIAEEALIQQVAALKAQQLRAEIRHRKAWLVRRDGAPALS